MSIELRTALIFSATCAGIIGVGTWATDRYYTGTRRNEAVAPSSQSDKCAPLPGLGATSILDKGEILRENVPFGTIAIQNKQNVSAVAILGSIALSRRYQAITVAPGGETRIPMPAGQYGLSISSGRSWCNLDRGFTDGRTFAINGGVSIKPGSEIRTIVRPGTAPGSISVTYDAHDRVRDGGSGLQGQSAFAPIVSWAYQTSPPTWSASSVLGLPNATSAKFLAYGFLWIAVMVVWRRFGKEKTGQLMLFRRARSRQSSRSIKDCYYNPKEFRSERPPRR